MLPDRQVRILMVEDNHADREIYKQCLGEIADGQFEFAEAGSGAAGIELARIFRPDCTLLDYDLPDGTGLDMLARFNQESDPGAIVMLTAFGGEDLAVRAMKAGVADYLPKRHVSPESLGATVATAIRKFEAKRPSTPECDRRQYANLLEAIPQMVWITDGAGWVQYANDRWLEYTGLTLETAGRLGWGAALHPDDRARTSEAWKSATASGSVFEMEHRLRRAADGSYHWHLVRVVPMKSPAGETAGWFGSYTGLGNQKQAEKASPEIARLETFGMLAGGIAHDFNNLLVGILGGASLVMDTFPAAHPSREILNDVIRAGEQAAGLTRKMLAYSGRGNSAVEAVDLAQLARETCGLVRHSVPIGIQLQFQNCGPLPLVEIDPRQMRHLIAELVMNAVEAIGKQGPGKIWVRCGLAEIDPALACEENLEAGLARGARFVALEVRDTGCGMDEDTLARIFEPFFTTRPAGRGLGLSAVQAFVRSSGGAIRARSARGEGAVFQVILPAAVEEGRWGAAGAEL